MKSASLFGHLVEILSLLDRTREPFDRTVNGYFRSRSYLGAADRRFLSSRIYGITRFRRTVEALFESYLDAHPSDADLNRPPERFLPVIAGYETLYGGPDGPEFPDALWKTYFPVIDPEKFRRWIDEHRDLDFLGPDRAAGMAVRYSFQNWMVEEWQEQVGDEIDELLVALNREAPVTLRVNLSKTSRAACRERLQSEGIESEETRMAPAGLLVGRRFNAQSLPSFRDGWFEVQDEGSQLVSLLAWRETTTEVIDGCAGAGGKTLHLADLLRNAGTVTAVEPDRRKIGELRTRAARAGYRNVRSLLADDFHTGEFAGRADLVLVDAPCTGSGTLRRNPALKWKLTKESLPQYAERQSMLLDGYANCVKPGGRLVYATCSLFREENEDVVRSFLSTHPSFLPAENDPASVLASDTPGSGTYHCYPHRTGTDGFFIAVLVRMAG